MNKPPYIPSHAISPLFDDDYEQQDAVMNQRIRLAAAKERASPHISEEQVLNRIMEGHSEEQIQQQMQWMAEQGIVKQTETGEWRCTSRGWSQALGQKLDNSSLGDLAR